MFKDHTIEKRVGAILKERVATAQANYEQERDLIEDERASEHHLLNNRYDDRLAESANRIASRVFLPI